MNKPRAPSALIASSALPKASTAARAYRTKRSIFAGNPGLDPGRRANQGSEVNAGEGISHDAGSYTKLPARVPG